MTNNEYILCRNIGIMTGLNNWNYFKRAQAINIFWGLDGLKAFVFGYQIGKDMVNPNSPYKWHIDDFMKGGRLGQ